MKISNQVVDEVILRELGERLARVRLERNLTQAGLAEQAGVSKRTVERLESGGVTQLVRSGARVPRAGSAGALRGADSRAGAQPDCAAEAARQGKKARLLGQSRNARAPAEVAMGRSTA